MGDIIYAARATTNEGRLGRVTSDDGRLDLVLSLPRVSGGDDGPGTNPEQLFAAGYAACFHTALVARLRANGFRDCRPSVTADVGMFQHAAGYRLDVTVSATMPGLDPADAARCLHEADQICPYSDALRGNAGFQVRLDEE